MKGAEASDAWRSHASAAVVVRDGRGDFRVAPVAACRGGDLEVAAPRISPAQCVDKTGRGQHFAAMPETIPAPASWIESIGKFRFPAEADRHLQNLMDRNNDGLLQPAEKEELAALAALSEDISLLRAQALQLLGRRSA